MNEKTAKIVNYIYEHPNVSNQELIQLFEGSSERFSNIRRRYHLPRDTSKKRTNPSVNGTSIARKDNKKEVPELPRRNTSTGMVSIYRIKDLYSPNDSLTSLRFIHYILTGITTSYTKRQYKKEIKKILNL